MCKAAGAPDKCVRPDAINTEQARETSIPFGGGVIVRAEITRRIIQHYHVPAGPEVTWSFLIPNVTNVEQLRSVMAYARL